MREEIYKSIAIRVLPISNFDSNGVNRYPLKSVLTVEPLGVEHPEHVRRRRVEERHACEVLGRHAELDAGRERLLLVLRFLGHVVDAGHRLGGRRVEGSVLERAHRVHPRLRGAVNERAVDPAGHAVQLLAGAVGALAGVLVVTSPVEGDVLVAATLLVVHIVALLDRDLVHLNRAPALAGHQDFA
jgi:hypothetical protein